MTEERVSSRKALIVAGGWLAGIALAITGVGFAFDMALGPGGGVPTPQPVPVQSKAPAEQPAESAAREETPGVASAVVGPASAEPPADPDSAGALDTSAQEPKLEPPAPVPTEAGASGAIVCIDAGHQGRGDSSLEPIGPGASERKPKVTSGAAGVKTGVAESLVNLQVAARLKARLQAKGVRVVMVRESEDVNVSNSERAGIANAAKADLFIRLHCDGAEDRSRSGISTLVPGRNQWTAPIVQASAEAGRHVHRAVVASTGAKDRGVVPRSDLSGFNWSKVPTVLVEMGFLSNPQEEAKLKSSAYQDRLAEGLADGVISYIEAVR